MTESNSSSNSTRSSSPGGAAWIAGGVGIVAVLGGIFYFLTRDNVPPGPKLSKIQLRKPSTVVVPAQPEHRERLQGAKFVPTNPPSVEVSYVKIDVVPGDPEIVGLPVTLPLDSGRHLALMTEEMRYDDPHFVDLNFEEAEAPGLYKLLEDARTANSSRRFRTTIFSWCTYRGSYVETSPDQKDLKVEDYSNKP